VFETLLPLVLLRGAGKHAQKIYCGLTRGWEELGTFWHTIHFTEVALYIMSSLMSGRLLSPIQFEVNYPSQTAQCDLILQTPSEEAHTQHPASQALAEHVVHERAAS
jgi:hypothetical protein